MYRNSIGGLGDGEVTLLHWSSVYSIVFPRFIIIIIVISNKRESSNHPKRNIVPGCESLACWKLTSPAPSWLANYNILYFTERVHWCPFLLHHQVKADCMNMQAFWIFLDTRGHLLLWNSFIMNVQAAGFHIIAQTRGPNSLQITMALLLTW